MGISPLPLFMFQVSYTYTTLSSAIGRPEETLSFFITMHSVQKAAILAVAWTRNFHASEFIHKRTQAVNFVLMKPRHLHVLICMFRVYETKHNYRGNVRIFRRWIFRTMVFCGMAFCSRDVPTFRKNHLPANQFTSMKFLAWKRLIQVRPKQWHPQRYFREYHYVRLNRISDPIKLLSLIPQFMTHCSRIRLGFSFSRQLSFIERIRQWLVRGSSITENNHLQRATDTRDTRSKQTQINRSVSSNSHCGELSQETWRRRGERKCALDVSSISSLQLQPEAAKLAHRPQFNTYLGSTWAARNSILFRSHYAHSTDLLSD
jgi:hypothetical protein